MAVITNRKILKSHKISKTNWTRKERQISICSIFEGIIKNYQTWWGNTWGDEKLHLPNRNVTRKKSKNISVPSLRTVTEPHLSQVTSPWASLTSMLRIPKEGACVIRYMYKLEVWLDKYYGSLLIFVPMIFMTWILHEMLCTYLW